MKKALILLIFILSLLSADIAIEPWGTSYHWDRDKKLNESNQYIGLVYRYDNYEFGISTFKNSHWNRSNAIYVGYKQPLFEYISVYADFGYVTGYSYKVLGAIGVYLEYEDIYLKTSINHKYIGFTFGYVFKGI